MSVEVALERRRVAVDALDAPAAAVGRFASVPCWLVGQVLILPSLVSFFRVVVEPVLLQAVFG